MPPSPVALGYLSGPGTQAKPHPEVSAPSQRRCHRLSWRQSGQTAAATFSASGGQAIDRILFALILALLALIFADLWLNAGAVLLFLMRELVDLVDYLIFWR